jgi:acetylornithine/N-succinyldiaminopimelate aminotransferase
LNFEELRALEERYVMQTYRRAPVEFVHGDGARLWDADGNEYLDFLSGISVCSVGHCHPAVVEAVSGQIERLLHVSNLFYSEPAVRLAERLCESSLGGKAFLTNSGSEANECAIKIARKHAHRRGVAEPEIITLERSFHGRTMGSLAATPGLAANPDFGPMLPGFRAVPIDDPQALRSVVGSDTAAVMIEPILGEAGVYPVPDETLISAREACDEAGALLICDEIQAGMGRTGSLWAYEQTPIRPDAITTAKALGGGLPVGACVASPGAAEVLGQGDHGSTFAGGPLVATAALAVLELVDDPELLGQVGERGAALREGLEAINGVDEVRGRGLMLGVGLEEGIEAADVAAAALRAGLVINAPEPRTLRLLPPLTISGPDIEQALDTLSFLIERRDWT